MNELDKARKNIDAIDDKIIKLYEKRMKEVKKIIEYKIQNNIAIVDKDRETEMLEKNLKKINDSTLVIYYQDVLQGFLKASKDMQQNILNSKK